MSCDNKAEHTSAQLKSALSCSSRARKHVYKWLSCEWMRLPEAAATMSSAAVCTMRGGTPAVCRRAASMQSARRIRLGASRGGNDCTPAWASTQGLEVTITSFGPCGACMHHDRYMDDTYMGNHKGISSRCLHVYAFWRWVPTPPQRAWPPYHTPTLYSSGCLYLPCPRTPAALRAPRAQHA